MVDLDKAKNYLRVDFNDDDVEIDMLLKSAYMYLEGATGKDYSNEENEKADIFILALIDDCYNDRGLTVVSQVEKMKYVYKSILLQLQLEGDINV